MRYVILAITGAHILLSLSHLSPDTGTGSGYRNRTLINPLVQPLIKRALQCVTIFHIGKACRVPSTRSESSEYSSEDWHARKGTGNTTFLRSSLSRCEPEPTTFPLKESTSPSRCAFTTSFSRQVFWTSSMVSTMGSGSTSFPTYNLISVSVLSPTAPAA
jgi:hypothetical protein